MAWIVQLAQAAQVLALLGRRDSQVSSGMDDYQDS
jgi:hypothetical protein